MYREESLVNKNYKYLGPRFHKEIFVPHIGFPANEVKLFFSFYVYTKIGYSMVIYVRLGLSLPMYFSRIHVRFPKKHKSMNWIQFLDRL